jgi:hypothetical protein
MPSKEQLKNIRAEALLIKKARAGVIPASDNIEAELELYVARIGRTVNAHAKFRHGDEALAISDILHELRHYCDSKCLAFGELNARAHEYYLEDVKESPWISRIHARTDPNAQV